MNLTELTKPQTTSKSKKLKRLIAREGLVFIGICFLFIICLALPNSVVIKDSKSEIDYSTH